MESGLEILCGKIMVDFINVKVSKFENQGSSISFIMLFRVNGL